MLQCSTLLYSWLAYESSNNCLKLVVKEHQTIWLSRYINLQGGYFYGSAQIAKMLKRKTLFNEWGSFVHREFHGTESLIGCHHYSLWYWKLWGTVTKTTLYIFSEIWQADLTVPPFQSESRLGILGWLAKTWKGYYVQTYHFD